MAKGKQAQVVITANASVAERVMQELEGAATRASNRMLQLAEAGNKIKEEMKQLAAANKQNTDEYKALSAAMKQNDKDYKVAEKEFQAFNSRMRESIKDSKRVEEVMKQLAKTASTDLKRALASATRELSKMSEDDKGRQRLINQIARIKEQIAGNNGLIMTLKKAKEQLAKLDSTPMDKLKQGLTALQQQYDKLTYKQQQSAAGQRLLAGINATKAQMAVNQTGPVSTTAVSTMTANQLRSEQSRLQSAIAATSASPQFAAQTAAYEARLRAVNDQLKQLAANEKQADAEAKKLQATQQAAQTVQAVYRRQRVGLDELNAAYQTLEARARQFAGVNPAKAQAATRQMAMLKARILDVTREMNNELKIDKQFLRNATNEQLQNALARLEQKLKSLNSTQSKAAAKIKQDMAAVQKQIDANTGSIQKQGSTFGTAIKNIAAYVGVFGAFNMIKSKVMSVYKSNLQLSDSLADIRKVSGLTSEEINKLYTNIAKIDTRNTIETLNKLAYAGAKLGIGQNYGVEGLTGFVRAAEQVQMALGEDLGEEALPALAKLTEVMGLIPK